MSAKLIYRVIEVTKSNIKAPPVKRLPPRRPAGYLESSRYSEVMKSVIFWVVPMATLWLVLQ